MQWDEVPAVPETSGWIATKRRIASRQVVHRSEPLTEDSCLQISHSMATFSFPKSDRKGNEEIERAVATHALKDWSRTPACAAARQAAVA